MSGAPACDKVLLVQAEFDGELDAAGAAALAAHRAGCAICKAAAVELARLRELQIPRLYEPVPEVVRARVMARIAATHAPQRSARPALRQYLRPAFWLRSAASFGLGAACAAALTIVILTPARQNLTGEIVAGHIRALQPGHLEDVISTDQHTVKPWFDGRLDFAPPVKDLANEGFPLKGGRLDYVDDRPVAALVYQYKKHIIDLYVWPAAGKAAPLKTAERQGYNVVQWTEGGMIFWAVSDLEVNLLVKFAEEWRQTS